MSPARIFAAAALVIVAVSGWVVAADRATTDRALAELRADTLHDRAVLEDRVEILETSSYEDADRIADLERRLKAIETGN